MGFYVVVRGPLGSGKSTVSERLAKAIGGAHIAIDPILEENGLEQWEEGYISEDSFLKANSIALRQAEPVLRRGRPVVFDGNFYWRSQIADLVARLNFPHHVFTLKAPLDLCVQRDSQRDPPHGREATESVYAKSTEFDWGVGIDATQPVESVVREIASRLSPDPAQHRW